MSRRPLAAAVAVVAALAGGCSQPEVTDGRAGGPVVPASPEAAPRPGASDPHGGLTCDGGTLEDIDTTIQGQLDALAGGDYDAALAFATEGFRAGTTPEDFRALIEADYAVLTQDAAHTSGTCVASGDQAQVLVTVEASTGTAAELVYRLSREDGEWRIAVAGLVPSGSETPTPIEV
jgi:hypothetical protein